MNTRSVYIILFFFCMAVSPASAAQVNLQLEPILNAWTDNSSIVSGFPDFGTSSSPIIFNEYRDGEIIGTYMLVFTSSGSKQVYLWDGDSWTDANELEGITLPAGATMAMWIMNEEVYAIECSTSGVWTGYHYNGATWDSDSSKVSGLGAWGNNVYFQVVDINGVQTMFIGDRASSLLRAVYWTGSTWATSPYSTGLPTGVTRGTPSVIEYHDDLYMIYGDTNGILRALKWTGVAWATSTSFTIDGKDRGTYTTPTLGLFGDKVWCIYGDQGGNVFGLRNNHNRWRMVNDGGTFPAAVPPIQHTVDITVEGLGGDLSNNYSWVLYRDYSRMNELAAGWGNGTQSCEVASGRVYWFIVAYNETTSAWVYSDYYTFVIDDTSTNFGSGVQGMVYDVTSYMPIENAIVTLSNDTWTSAPSITASNGAYVIYAPTPGTYTVTAIAEDYSTLSYIVTIGDTFTVKNMPMIKAQSYFEPLDVTFKIVRHWYSINGVEGATYEVYPGESTESIQTGTTDSTGSFVVPDMEAGTKYRLVLTITEDGTDTETVYVYPSLTSYRIIFEADSDTLPPDQFYDAVNVSITQNLVDASTGRINVSYTDNAASTASVYFQLGQTDENGEFVVLQTSTTGSGNMTYSFEVEDPKGESYIVKLVVNHTMFGNITKTYAVQFPGNTLPHADSKIWGYLAIGILLVVGFQWGSADASMGAVLVCGTGWFLWYLDLFIGFGSTTNTTIGAGLVLGTAYAVLAIFNKKGRTEV